MNNNTKFRRTVSLLACTFLATACASPPKAPASWDGLQLQPGKGFTAVYTRPGVEFRDYRSVMLEPVEVSFDKQWSAERARNDLSQRFTPEALEAIDAQMAETFRRIFTAELRRGGYAIVDKPDGNTLRIRPSLVDIYINAPVDISPGHPGTYLVEAARMTLVMELRDGPTGQLLARVVDQKAGASTGSVEISDSVAETPAFRSAVTDWATQLRGGLDEINGKK
jgi:Protein of unknown function (DUF3313)